MEPFSIATGIVSLLAAIDQAQKCVCKVRAMRSAHYEIIQLAEDVSDLHETLLHVLTLANQGRDNPLLQPEALRTLEHLGNKAAGKLEKLAAFIPDVDQPRSSSSEGQGRFSPLTKLRPFIKEEHWQWSRNKADAQQLQRELRGIQLNVLINLSVICSSTSLQNLSRPESNAIVLGIERQVIDKGTIETGALVQSEQPAPNSPPPDYDKSVMTRRLPQLPEKASLALAPSKFSCQDWCSCRCHKRTSLRTKSQGGGSLFVSSNGMVFGLSSCDQQQCRRSARRTFKLIYRPPKWLSDTQFQLSFLCDPLYGPELNVRLPRTVGWSAPLWTHALHGNTVAIREMFDNGEASPFDVNPLGGSILHYAADRCYFDLCRLLIQRGATPFLVDDLGGNPTWKAWEHTLTGKLTEDEAKFVRDSFEGEEYLESRQFTVLHKIVLGLTKLDLVSMLQISTSDIDAVDAEGKTCLAWAALRADAATVKILLQFGADPNVVDLCKRTPLHHVRGAECCNLLLQQGADIEAKEEGGRTALHWACRSPPGNPTVVSALLAAGVDPNIRDNVGETALVNATLNGFEECAIALLTGSTDATNDGVDLIKCFSDAVTCEQYGVLRCLQVHCERFAKFAHVLQQDLVSTLPGSETEATLLEYFKSEQTHINSLGADDLRAREADFLQTFGLHPSPDITAEKLEVFVDALEVLPDLTQLVI